ncbi:MAG: hypothetical protein FWE34_06750 [Defluviitaleaceae bacterium]|nr:hypothetical protein [Defluviitaleaceae bacterium]
MPRGFSGATVERFFKKTNEAMDKAAEAHSKNPLKGMPKGKIPLPRIQEGVNVKLPFEPGDANPHSDRYKTGVGNSSNIIVEQTNYDDIAKKMDNADDKVGEMIYKMCCEVEQICSTIYTIPETNPKILSIAERIKDALPKFRELTENANIETRRFVREVGDTDRAPDSFKVVLSEEGAEDVVSATKNAVQRQVANMESTARSYTQAANTLKNQANSFQRQIDNNENRMCVLEGQIKALEEREAMQSIVNPFGRL